MRNVGSLGRPGPIPVLRGGQHRDIATLLVVMTAGMAVNAAPTPWWHQAPSRMYRAPCSVLPLPVRAMRWSGSPGEGPQPGRVAACVTTGAYASWHLRPGLWPHGAQATAVAQASIVYGVRRRLRHEKPISAHHGWPGPRRSGHAAARRTILGVKPCAHVKIAGPGGFVHGDPIPVILAGRLSVGPAYDPWRSMWHSIL